jgi:tetraacyldisaccharide 4'-kinase
MNFLLRALTHLYRAAWGLETSFFEQATFLRASPQARVVCIGNLTMGGTGKTPVLLELLHHLAPTTRCAVLTRGYRSPWERGSYLVYGQGPHPEELTDETLLVNRRFPQVPLLVGKNRAHTAHLAEKWFSPRVLLLDDGFQYRRLRKDLTLLLWDATLNPSTAELIPAGTLREPIEQARGASALFITRSEAVSPEALRQQCRFFQDLLGKTPIIPLFTRITGWKSDTGEFSFLETGQRVFAFSAVGNPTSFETQVKQSGVTLVDSVRFRDHHRFSAADLERVLSCAKQARAVPVCTEKDLIKIPADIIRRGSIQALAISMQPAVGSSWSGILTDLGLFSRESLVRQNQPDAPVRGRNTII